jgi:hypothetical protein
MTNKEVMQMALDALESWQKTCLDCARPSEELGRSTKPLQALRAALAQPEPEPVLLGTDYEAAFYKDWNAGKVRRVSDGKRMVPEREWVGLTDEEIESIYAASRDVNYEYERAIEAKLKEKNDND